MSTFSKDPIRGVHTVYGARSDEGAAGFLKSGENGKKTLMVVVTAESLQHGYVAPIYLPAGSFVTRAWAETEEAFAGTTIAVSVGTEGLEASNGVTVAEADLEAVGTVELTPSGTWTARLATATKVGVSLAGTLTDTSAGKVKVVVEFLDV